MTDEFQVRRAGRKDIPAIAALVDRAAASGHAGGEAEVMEWLLGKGVVVATRDGAVAGVAAWQAENLLSVTDVFHVAPEWLGASAGSQLLAAIEEQANTLMCEANVLLLPHGTTEPVRRVVEAQGYQRKELAGLHRIWREVLADWMQDEPDLMVKRLRDRMVMAPL